MLFIGNGMEINQTTGEITKYYFAGTQRIALRKYTIPQSMSVEYFLGDHLGSTSITTDTAGAKVSEMRYKPLGEVWKASQTTTPAYALTRFTFTGQYSHIIPVGRLLRAGNLSTEPHRGVLSDLRMKSLPIKSAIIWVEVQYDSDNI